MSATCFPHCHSSVCSSRSASCFPHCRSSACSRRSANIFSPLPQQCLLPQEHNIYFPTAAAVPAPAGAFPVFPHCRSSVRSRRSSTNTSPLPQQCLLPQEHHIYFPTAAAVSTLTSSLPSPHHHTSTLQQKPLLPPDAAASLQALSSIPSALKPCIFGGSLSLFGCCPTISILWGALGPGQCRARTPLPGRGEYPGLGNYYRARSPLLGQHAKYAYRLLSSLLSKCELVKACLLF